MSASPVREVGISIVAPTGPVCRGSYIGFTATASYGGIAPIYQWKVNGGNAGTNSATFNYQPNDGEVVTCVLTSSAGCTTGNPATSNQITMSVNESLPAGVSVVASANPACIGATVQFTATPVNGGSDPTYEWRVNDIPIETTHIPTFSYTLNNDYTLQCIITQCIITSNNGCPASNTAISNLISMVVSPMLQVGISILPSANPLCEGAFITFTATPVHGGTQPHYQWKVKGVNAGADQPTYTYAPVSGDSVRCTLTSSEQCAITNPVISNKLIMTVKPIISASVSVTADDTVCPGTQVSFTANAINGGTTPAYQWYLNNNPGGANNPVFTVTPGDGDKISCRLTSSELCLRQNPVISSDFIIHTNTPLPGSINITASANPFCQGSAVTFNSAINNGGSSPKYKWKKNGDSVGMGPTYTYVPAHGDFITCTLTS
ncbi:MAG: PKD domain-containing protein, partial [Bacteroidetes bacterium]|nr:PKD domain-containing protein [Bacteroidota bacterium]